MVVLLKAEMHLLNTVTELRIENKQTSRLFLPVSFVYVEEGIAHEVPIPHRRTQGESPMRNGEDT